MDDYDKKVTSGKKTTDEEYYKYLKNDCGFNDEQIKQIFKDREYFRNELKKEKQPRYITTSTYERIEKRTSKEIFNFLK